MDDSSYDERTIFVANLSPEVTEDVLYELFLQSGPIEEISIPKDKDGRSRNFGFVTYIHKCAVEYALDLFEGTKLFRREIRLKKRNPNNSSNSNINPGSPSTPGESQVQENPMPSIDVLCALNSLYNMRMAGPLPLPSPAMDPIHMLQQYHIQKNLLDMQTNPTSMFSNASMLQNNASMLQNNFWSSTPANNQRNRDRERGDRDRDEFVHRNRRNDNHRDRPYSRPSQRERRSRSRSPIRRGNNRNDSSRSGRR